MSDNFENDAIKTELQAQMGNQAPEQVKDLANQTDFTAIVEKPDNNGNIQRYGIKQSDGSVMQMSEETRKEIDQNLAEYRDRWRVKDAIASMFEDARGNPQNLGLSMDIFFGAVKGAMFDAPAEVIKTIMPDNIDGYVDKYQGLLPDSKTSIGQLSQVGSQALAPTGVFNKALKGLGIANGLLRYTTSGVATDFAAFDPNDTNLGDIAKDIGTLDNNVAESIRSTIADSLAKNVDDSEFEKRLKNAGGGLLTQFAFDSIGTGYKALRKISSQVDLQPLFDSLEVSAKAQKKASEQAGKVSLPKVAKEQAKEEFKQGAKEQTKQSAEQTFDYDFNLKNLGTSKDADDIINFISKQYQDDITKATVGTTKVQGRTIPNDVIDDLSTRLAVDKGKVAKLVEKFPSDVEDLSIKATAMRKVLVDTTTETERLAKEIANTPREQVTDEMVVKFREQITRQAAIQRKLKGTQTEIARALQSFRIYAQGTERSNAILEISQNLGGADTAVEIARRLNDMPLDKQAEFLEKTSFATSVKDVFFEYWINGLLSGPKTHLRNILGNEGFKLLQPFERAVASGVGTVRKKLIKGTSPEQVRIGELNEMLMGYFDAMPDALSNAWKAIKSEDFTTSAMTKIEQQQFKAITPEKFGIDEASTLGRAIDYIGQGVRFPGRLLKAEDEFSRATAQNMELRAQAYRARANALDKGASEKEAEMIYKDALAGKIDSINDAVKSFEDMVTFVTPLGDVGKSVQNLTQKSAIAKMIMPFVRTPTNIFKEFTKRTPAAPIMKEVRDQIAKGGIEADMAISRIATGSTLLAWASYLVASDKLTGAGPEGALRKPWLENYQPYSVKVGDKWYSYQGLEPVSSLFGIAADASDFMKYNDAEDENESVAVNAVFSIIKNLGEKTYMQGLANFAAAWENPQQFGTYYAQSTAGSLVPSIVRDIRRVNDPYYRNISKDKVEDNWFDTYLKAVKDRTPGFSDSQPPKRNYWGEPIRAWEDNWINTFNPFNPRKVKYSPIDEELLRLDFPLNMPRKEIMGTKISNKEYDDLVVRYNSIALDGMNLRDRLNYTIVTPSYIMLDDDDKREVIRSISRQYIDYAKKELVNENFDLQQRVLIQKLEE